MQIRPMKLEDIEQVVAMENKTWDNFNTPASLPAANKHKIIQAFQNHSHYLVAEENGVILGVLDYHAYYPFPSARHVVSFIIAVDKDTQGQGIGHSLIRAFFAMAKSDNYKKLLSTCYHQIKTPAVSMKISASLWKLPLKINST